jgi:hypothetical protein
VNARADIDANGVGGQTPIFHAVAKPEIVQLLLERGAALTIRARAGHCKRPDEVLDVSADYRAMLAFR